ncbi:MAG: alpha-2,8-polysialyltransferase family protein [Gammaproteobacteria bacterium]|nr:alpha-2,8-polysialyltransferase family protein [Gammaproteobacteria bacterium]
MNYFLINNNYHYIDFFGHKHLLLKKDTALIEIPHTLDKRNHDDIAVVYRYEIPHHKGLLSQIFKFLLTVKKINFEIHPVKEDILFFYTEYEILNQYLVDKFKRVGARAFLIEDGGLGTYVPFRMLASEPLSIKELLRRTVYRQLPGLKKTRLHKLNGVVFPWMPDTSIDGVCIYKPVKLQRTFQAILLQRLHQTELAPIRGRVIFLNEAIYQFYQAEKEYLDGLELLIEGLCDKYVEVLFKFHPRETNEWRERIRKEVLSRFSAVAVIEENSAIEIMIEKYRPSAVASYFCSALLSLSDRGIEPVYLYHLIPELNNQPIFIEITLVLKELGYHFVSSLSEVGPGYKSGWLHRSNIQGAITLAELVADR